MATTFEKANKATLPFLSFAARSFGLRFIRSPATDADTLALVWPASNVYSFISARGKEGKINNKKKKDNDDCLKSKNTQVGDK